MDGPDQNTHSTRAEPPTSRAAGIVWFYVFSTVGVVAVAAAVLLPEYSEVNRLQTRRDAHAHQLECDKQLAVYNERKIRAMRQDPDMAARMLIRYANYSPAGYQPIAFDLEQKPDATPMRILKDAGAPPQPKYDPLVVAGNWMDDRPTRTSLIFLGLGTLAMGLILFGSQSSEDD